LFILWRPIRLQNSVVLRWVKLVLSSRQVLEPPPFWNACSYSVKNYGVEITFYGVTSLLNFIKSTNWIRSWKDTQTHVMAISLAYSFPLWRKVGWQSTAFNVQCYIGTCKNNMNPKIILTYNFIPKSNELNLNSVNQLIFVMVKCGVLFEVRTEFLNNI
jgi:hypothetical protein